MINFLSFRKDVAEPKVLINGRRVFKDGNLDNIRTEVKSDKTFLFTATVESEKDPTVEYLIELQIEPDGELSDYSCDCPYFKKWGRSICKHLIGGLFHIENNGLFKEKDKKKHHCKHQQRHEERKKIVDVALGMDFVNKEIECQICLDILKKPVIMPCFMHSVCTECCRKLFTANKKVKQKDQVACPTCSCKAGVFEVNEFTELKPNKELERVIEAYKRERNTWFEQKNKLTGELNQLKEEREKQDINFEGKSKEQLVQIINKAKEMKKQRERVERAALKVAERVARREAKRKEREGGKDVKKDEKPEAKTLMEKLLEERSKIDEKSKLINEKSTAEDPMAKIFVQTRF